MKTSTCLLLIAAALGAATHSLAQPAITIQPAEHNAYLGSNVTFQVADTGNPELVYQWRFNRTTLTGRTEATLILENLEYANAGQYDVVVTETTGSRTSQVARLAVLPHDVTRAGNLEIRVSQTSPDPVWEGTLIDDGSPSVSGDELTLFYSSAAPGGSGKSDLWMLTRTSRSADWGSPVNLGSAINSASDDANPRPSPDGLSLYFDSDRPGGQGGSDIWVATRAKATDPFGAPVNLGPNVNSPSDDGASSISADNTIITFASDRAGGLGNLDDWIVTRPTPGAAWGSPMNLGAPLNTTGVDIPFLSADGLTLFNKSPGPAGGPSRIWLSKRDNRASTFGPPTWIKAISDAVSGLDYLSLSADGVTLYVNTYVTKFPDWSSLRKFELTALPNLRALGMTANRELQVELQGREGISYSIETSADLKTWTPQTTATTPDSVRLDIPAPADQSSRFIRAVAP